MTLINKINFVMVSILLLLCSLLGYVQFKNNLQFLQQELNANAEITVRNLNVALVSVLESGDSAKSDALFTTLLETGTIDKASLLWLLDGKHQSWDKNKSTLDVPGWFINTGLIEPVTVDTTVRSGWIELAKLRITMSPDYSYQTLWKLSVPILGLTLVSVILVSILIRFSLRRILSPLNAISEEAKKIARLEFSGELALPKSRDLRELTSSFNSMSSQLAQLFDTLNEEVARLREKTLYDTVSGMPNRSYFIRRVNSWMEEEGVGVIMLVKLNWFEVLNQRYGYEVRDQSWKLLGKAVKSILASSQDSMVAKLSHNEIALMIPGADSNEAKRILQVLIRLLNNEVTQSGLSINESFAIGLVVRENEASVSELLAKADNALREAESSGLTYQFAKAGFHYSKEQWRQHIADAIESKKINLSWQPAIDVKTGEIIKREAFFQMEVDGQAIQAAQLLPIIERLSFGGEFDRMVLSELAAYIAQSDVPICVNLTADSLKDPDFIPWLLNLIQLFGIKDVLQLELNEAIVYRSPETAYRFCTAMREYNIRYGIDHFGRQLGSLAYLKRLRPDYVKLDQSFSKDDSEESNSLLILPLVNMASSLGIDIIVTGIQYQEQLVRFEGLSIHAYQGFISPLEPLPRLGSLS